ncbi:TetR-like C-terminal domain-containing protein [Microbacterium sp. GXF0217]
MTSGAAGGADRLRTVGTAYIDFALAEPGWFAVAFFGSRSLTPEATAATPTFRALAGALADLVSEGALDVEAAEAAAWSCWATVHGFAELCLGGPLAGSPREEQRRLAASAVEATIAGILVRPSS